MMLVFFHGRNFVWLSGVKEKTMEAISFFLFEAFFFLSLFCLAWDFWRKIIYLLQVVYCKWLLCNERMELNLESYVTQRLQVVHLYQSDSHSYKDILYSFLTLQQFSEMRSSVEYHLASICSFQKFSGDLSYLARTWWPIRILVRLNTITVSEEVLNFFKSVWIF